MKFQSTLFVLLLLLCASRLDAQIPQVTEETQVPSPGDGHDYIHWLNETVNPSNGSVTVRIAVPIPSSRQFSIPFYLAYNSGQALTGPAFGFQPNNSSDVSLAGWSYTVPVMTYFGGIYYDPDHPPGTCDYTTDYVFADASGKSTQMHIASSDGSDVCLDNGFYNVYGMSENYGLLADLGPDEWDVDGTYYKLSTPSRDGGAGGGSAYFASQIEDRNGNLINIAYDGNGAFTYTDTMGRPVLSSSGFGSGTATLTSSKFSAPYTVTWGTAAYNYSVDFTIDPDGSVNCPSLAPETAQGSMPVISSIELPNGQSYSFTYDPTYGRLSKITYPSGAYARYVWGWRSNVSQWLFTEGSGFDSYTCRTFYGEPVITDRYVSTDGVTETEHQHFVYTSYYPGFNDVKTTLTDTDLTTGQVVRTVTYNYTDSDMPAPPYESNWYGSPVFDETSEVYAAGSSTLRTVAEAWSPDGKPSYKITTLEDGSTASETVWCYDGNDQLTEKDEFGYSGTGSPGGTCNPNLPPAVGPLMRKTITAYNPSFGQFDGTSLTGQWIVDRPAATTVYDGSGNRVAETDYTYGNTTSPVTVIAGTHDDTNYSSSSNLNRANLLSATNQCFPNCANAVTSYAYDDTGQVTSTTDPNLNMTTYSYADHFDTGTPPGATDGYVTQITYPFTNGVSHQESFTYNYEDGTLATTTDENSQITHYSYSDSMDRLKTATYPDGGSTTYTYQDAPPMSTTVTEAITGSVNKTNITTYDNFGREIQTELSTDPDGPTFTAMQYDGLGRKYRVWNPTRCTTPTTNCGTEPTWGYTTYAYDALDRTTSVTEQDNSTIGYNYSLNCTIITDEAGNNRESCTDALGRLNQVVEDPGTSPHFNYVTNYTYDALDDLLGVAQNGSRQRTFMYDFLSRLTSSTNPESNWSSSAQTYVPTTYAYDANSNLISKTAPAPSQQGTATVTFTYCYDALNRRTAKADSPQSCSSPAVPPFAAIYAYDQANCQGAPQCFNIGQRTGMTDQAGSESWAYDKMGRAIVDSRTTIDLSTSIPQTQTFTNTYNLDGSLASIAYPMPSWASPQTIGYTEGGAGRATDLSSNGNNGYLYNVHYTPNGALCTFTTGWGASTDDHISYNNRLQPTEFQYVGTYADANENTCATLPPGAYGTNVDLLYEYTAPNGGNNGNPSIIYDPIYWPRSQYFTYDSLNRLQTAETMAQNNQAHNYDTGHCWGESYSYDPWGNLLSIGVASPDYNGCAQENLNQSVDTQNHVIGETYDAAGNLISIPEVASYTFDAENHLISAGGVNYSYDGDGRRASKSSGVDYFYDGHDSPLQEDDPNGTPIRSNFFFNGKRVLSQEGPASNWWVDQFWTDAVGNVRGVYSSQSWQTGQNDDIDYYPLGGERTYVDHGDNNYKFTGKERDAESNLDNFEARYYSSQTGRFMSPDDPFADQDTGDPESWNLYTYVRNNPLRYTDPDGHNCFNSSQTSYHYDSDGNLVVEDSCNLGDELWDLFDRNLVSPTVNTVQQAAQQTYDFFSASRTPGCVAASTVAGAGVGLGKGLAVGAVGGGGVLDEATIPLGALGGTVEGAIAGDITGLIACRTGSGGAGGGGGGGNRKWSYGSNKSPEKWANQLRSRGWTEEQIDEAIEHGQQYKAQNNINPAHGATRFVNPTTGQSVVLDDVTGEVIHVGRPGFKY